MSNHFWDSRERIKRAISHAKSIANTWETLIDREHGAEPEIVKVGPGDFVVRASVRYAPENDMALLVGEYFYQLRAALDAVAYRSLILQEGLDPPEKADSVEFPIYADEGKFNRNPLIKSSLPDELKTWLRSFQPFAFPASSDPGCRELGRRLKLLHDCARKDRHRRLHVTMATITNLETAFQHTTNLRLFDIEPIAINILNGETDFLRFKVAVIGEGQRNIRLATGVTIELAIQEIEGFAGNALMQELERIMLGARHIVEYFEAGFQP